MIETAVLTLILSLVQTITALILKIPVAILTWVNSDPVSFTKVLAVQIGWDITRSFVNIFLVLALIAIGLATILRIESYKAQKTLPNLIIAAILVNFTPVICGLIIDLANIIMNIFQKAAFGNIQIFADKNAAINRVLEGGILNTVFNPANIGRLIAGILFNVLSSFILFAYALIFILRIMVLWVLVIFSPFALFGFFFPIAKNIWREWWKQFIQWTIIGIPLFFFLYLTGVIIENPVCMGTLRTGAGLTEWLSTQGICKMMEFIFPIFFLIIGLFVSLKTGVAGVDKAISWGENTFYPQMRQAFLFFSRFPLLCFSALFDNKDQ